MGYQVHYSGVIVNVNSSITTLIFTAPSLPDDVFTGTVVVMVTAFSRYGIGPASEPANATLTGMNKLLTRAFICVYYAIVKIPNHS